MKSENAHFLFGVPTMDEEAVKILWALRQVNQGLIEAMKGAIFLLEKGKILSEKRRKTLIESLKNLIAQSEEAYGNVPTKH